MEAQGPVGPPPVKSNRTGTRCGSRIPPACWRAPACWTLPPHHVSAEETINIARTYEFLVLFTSTPGWPGDIRLAHAIKDANPNIKIAFVGPHVTVLPEKSLRDCPAIDFVCRKEFDYTVVEFAEGKPLDGNSPASRI